MAEKIKVLITEEEVDARIRELGEKISKEYEGKQIHLICVLKGGVFFMCELAKRITVPVSMDFMCVGSYGDGTKSSGVVRLAKDLDESIENKEVLIVEDIIDSGNTLYYLMDVLVRESRQVSVFAHFDKPLCLCSTGKNVSDVYINQNSAVPTGTVSVTLKDDGNTRKVNVSDVEQVEKLLTENQVEYRLSDVPKDSMLTTVVVPMLITLGGVFLIFFPDEPSERRGKF